MTIKTAASAIVDDLVDSGSFLRTQVSACDFGVLDNMSTCAVTVEPNLSTFRYIGYGGVREDSWGFMVTGWVRDMGDVEGTLGRMYDMHDALIGAVNGGSIANCASLYTRVESIQVLPPLSLAGGDVFMVQANTVSREDP
jgi:hypothetical protein